MEITKMIWWRRSVTADLIASRVGYFFLAVLALSVAWATYSEDVEKFIVSASSIALIALCLTFYTNLTVYEDVLEKVSVDEFTLVGLLWMFMALAVAILFVGVGIVLYTHLTPDGSVLFRGMLSVVVLFMVIVNTSIDARFEKKRTMQDKDGLGLAYFFLNMLPYACITFLLPSMYQGEQPLVRGTLFGLGATLLLLLVLLYDARMRHKHHKSLFWRLADDSK